MKKPYGDLTSRVIARIAGRHHEMVRLGDDAGRHLEALLRLTETDRRQWIRQAPPERRGPRLIDLLLEESRRRVATDPQEAADLAGCACELAERLDPVTFGPAWLVTEVARADAHRGDARRAAGDLAAAERLLAGAHERFGDRGNGDLLVLAEILGFVAALRRDQGRFREAEEALREAADLYRECGQRPPS